MTHVLDRIQDWPAYRSALAAVRRWQAFSRTPLGVKLAPLYAALAGSAIGVLIADQLVRSMWRHAVFTGPDQWRTVALILSVLWVLIGAVAGLAVLGPPGADDRTRVSSVQDRTPDMVNTLEQS